MSVRFNNRAAIVTWTWLFFHEAQEKVPDNTLKILD